MIEEIANLPESAALIPLSRGAFTIVDTELLRILNLYRWSLLITHDKKRYARRYENGQTIYMHREIMNAPSNMEIDHKNGNGLDNRKENLRLSTKSENQMNSKKRRDGSSIFKGVDCIKKTKKWRARITTKYKRIHLGYFNSEIEAAEAYDKQAIYHFGEFAKTNFKGVIIREVI
ncbi:hypothetical protein ES703_22936 [subsurface metagenome]